MKMMRQESEFAPRTIVLNTAEETKVFWAMVRQIELCADDDGEYEMAVTISNWFSNQAQFSGR